MIWEQRSLLVVMLTKAVEGQNIKADRYFPVTGDETLSHTFGDFVVTLEKEEEICSDLMLRLLRLGRASSPEDSRQIVHIHYTGWPDFGRPSDTKTFEKLLELVDLYKTSSLLDGPIVSHCSAGPGRTGTLITAHIAAERLRLGEEIDVKSIVGQLRKQRSGMVQSVHQYVFLHEVLNQLVQKATATKQGKEMELLNELEDNDDVEMTEVEDEEDSSRRRKRVKRSVAGRLTHNNQRIRCRNSQQRRARALAASYDGLSTLA